MTPLGSAVEPLGELQDRERVGIDGGRDRSGRRGRPGAAGGRQERRSADRRARRLEERREVGVDDDEREVGMADPRRVWTTNSSIEPSRIGSGSTTSAAPASHVAWMAVTSVAGRRPEQRDVVAGPDPSSLKHGLPWPGPRRGTAPTAHDSGSPPVTNVTVWPRAGGHLHPTDKAVHEDSDPPGVPLVTPASCTGQMALASRAGRRAPARAGRIDPRRSPAARARSRAAGCPPSTSRRRS